MFQILLRYVMAKRWGGVARSRKKRVIYDFENRGKKFDAIVPAVLVRCVGIAARCECSGCVSLRSNLCSLNRIRAHSASSTGTIRWRALCQCRSCCKSRPTSGRRVPANPRLQIRELHRGQKKYQSPETTAKSHQNVAYAKPIALVHYSSGSRIYTQLHVGTRICTKIWSAWEPHRKASTASSLRERETGRTA